MKTPLKDLLKAMAYRNPEQDPAWQISHASGRVEILTSRGLWVFEPSIGRKAQSYLKSNGASLRHYRRYELPLSPTDLVLLALLADVVDAATRTTQEDWRFVDELGLALAALRAWLGGRDD